MKLYDLVKDLLVKYPALRNSDKQLIWNVYGSLGLLDRGIITKSSFLDAPAEESITRARRKVQEKHPELQATEVVKSFREEKEQTKGTFVYREKVSLFSDEDFE